MVKVYKAKSAKEKVHGTQPRGDQVLASKSPLTAESHKTCWIPPSLNCDNMRQVYVPGKLIRDSAPRVFIGIGCRYPLPKIQAPRKKAGIQHTLYCLHKQFSCTVNPPEYWLGNCKNAPEAQVSRWQPRASLVSRPFLRITVSGLLCYFSELPTGSGTFLLCCHLRLCLECCGYLEESLLLCMAWDGGTLMMAGVPRKCR